MSLLRSGVDTYVLYSIVRRLATPFTDWKAYKLGVIDDRGNFLIPKKDRTDEQYYSLTYLDIFVMNLKKLLQKIPGGNNKFVTYAAALWLLREDRYIKMDMLTEDGEGVPANTSSGGGLARSSEKEAKAFKKSTINLKRIVKQLNTAE